MIWVITSLSLFNENGKMTSFDPTLKSQHEAILALLERFAANSKSGKQVELKTTALDLRQLIFQHDRQEWDLLFSKHAFNKDLNQGGPYCMYFFDSFMMNRPREQVIQLLRTSKNSTLAQRDFQIEEHLQPLFAANSMMSVPLEEHLAIKLLLEAVLQTLEEENSDPLWLHKCCELLSTLIKKNIEKEETCLWILTQNLCAKSKL